MPRETEELVELAITGDLTDRQSDLCDKLLEVPIGGECVIYFDSPGGSPYTAMAMVSLLTLRGLRATGIVAGECSSAALWPFAACRRRLVLPCSTALFHRMKWQSDENVGLCEAAEWARHFALLEQDMDRLLVDMFGVSTELIDSWVRAGRYVTGPEMAAAGIAELIDFKPLELKPLDAGRKRRGAR